MGRSKLANLKTFKTYNLLHSKKVRMRSGVSMTALYPIKETAEFYRSIEVWASCASFFKIKKKNINLDVSIPILNNTKAETFLYDNCSKNWVAESNSSDIKETIEVLSKIIPNKEFLYFYELESLLNAFCHGSFISLNANGEVEPVTENQIKVQKYYSYKYNRFITSHEDQSIKNLYTDYSKCKDDDKGEVLFKNIVMRPRNISIRTTI